MMEKIEKLNPMQKEAVLQTDGAILILAGAGSGKTRVLTHKIAYLLEKGVRPFNILAITFTNKASKEMKERVIELSSLGEQVLISTFHSTCVRILRQHIDKIGYTNKFSIYDADDSEKMIKEIMKEHKINPDFISHRLIMSVISGQKDKLISSKEYIEKNDGDKERIIGDVYKEYEKRLKENNALDFDDLIFKTVSLFSACPDVLLKYQERFKYIMVDEYQDTSRCQYIFVKLLAQKHKNVCVVGDDDQSIYGWRGADIKNMLSFETDFAPVKIIKLEQNYRSSKTILDVANYVIKNNFARKNKSLWTENEKGEHIKYEKCTSDRTEANFVINTIIDNVKKGYSYKDFAILYRNNSLSRVIEEQLVFLSVPYKIYGGVNFYGRKEIKDIIAYLKVLENPSDDIALKRIINMPKRGIGGTTMAKVSDYATKNNITFFEALKNASNIENLGRKTKSLTDFYNLLENFINRIDDTPISELIQNILEGVGYLKEIEKEGTDEALSRKANLDEFVNKATEYDMQGETGLTGFLENVSLIADIDSMEDTEDVVTLMTIHSSKGLEFPIVFIVGFEEGIFPTGRALMSGDSAVEEERRLLYVGITRAKAMLYITSAMSRLQNGKYMDNMVSSFYKELPKELIQISEPKKKETLHISEQANHNKYRPNPKYKPNVSAHLKRDMPIPKNVMLDFSVGDTVSHFKFRNGKVLDIKPAGADYEVTIEFEKFGTKKLMANLSKLKKI